MKIGILTFHHSNYNYGAVLQAFSIYKLVESLGYESYMIDYIPEPPSAKKKLAVRILALLGFEFRKFRKKHIRRILPNTNHFGELKKLNALMDGFIAGSDQVWRYRRDVQAMYRYYLDFADETKPKIAYAASFGVDHWEAGEKETAEVKKLINRFQAVSVREESGVKICSNVFGVKAVSALDPTLVLDPKFFHQLADEIPVSKNNKKELVYMLLDDSAEKENFFKAIARKHGMAFKRINGKKLVPKKGFFLFKSVNSWLSAIKYADLVITDSFHCTVFSILFKRKFVCIANKHRGVTRLENLLALIHLENRLVFDLNQIDENLINDGIDFNRVELLLSSEKERSLTFLKTSLKLVNQNK